MRVRIDERGILDDGLVDLDHLAGKRREDVGGCLHGFDDRRAVAFRELGADLGQLDEDEIAEQLRRVRRDAHGRDVSFELKPLMLFGEFQQCILLISGGSAAFVFRHDERERS